MMLRLVLPRMPLRVPQEPLPLTAAEVPPLAPAADALVVLLAPVPPAGLAAMDPALLVVPASGRELMPADVVPSLTAGGDFGPTDAALVPPLDPGPITFADVPAFADGFPGLAPPGAAPLEPHAVVVTTNKFAIRNSDVDRIVLTARG